MRVLVVYDSAYGNTEKVAQTVKDALIPLTDVVVRLVTNVKLSEVQTSDIIFVGSPTQGGRPTAPIQEFLDELPDDVITSKPFAVFDTRFATNDHGLFLKLLMKTIGFAAPKMVTTIQKKGGVVLKPAEGFIVLDKEGPLDKKELSHAFGWAQSTFVDARTKTVVS